MIRVRVAHRTSAFLRQICSSLKRQGALRQIFDTNGHFGQKRQSSKWASCVGFRAHRDQIAIGRSPVEPGRRAVIQAPDRRGRIMRYELSSDE